MGTTMAMTMNQHPYFGRYVSVADLYGRKSLRPRPQAEVANPLPPIPLRQRTPIEAAMDRALSMRGLKLHTWAKQHGIRGSYVRQLVTGKTSCGPRGRKVLELVRDELQVEVSR